MLTIHNIVLVALTVWYSITAARASACPYEALVIVPIADLVGAPIQTFFPDLSPEQGYDDLPLCGGIPAAYTACPRLHQLIFNEIVTVLEEHGPEVRIKISNCFYVTKDSYIPQHTYWTLKKKRTCPGRM